MCVFVVGEEAGMLEHGPKLSLCGLKLIELNNAYGIYYVLFNKRVRVFYRV